MASINGGTMHIVPCTFVLQNVGEIMVLNLLISDKNDLSNLNATKSHVIASLGMVDLFIYQMILVIENKAVKNAT